MEIHSDCTRCITNVYLIKDFSSQIPELIRAWTINQVQTLSIGFKISSQIRVSPALLYTGVDISALISA